MARKKYTLDYIVKSSPNILFNFLSTSSGLSQWFADDVKSIKNDFSFFWDGYEEKAMLVGKEDRSFVRFHMIEGVDGEYFELKIERSPITGDTILIITDFGDDDEIEDQTRLWNSMVDSLISKVGGRN